MKKTYILALAALAMAFSCQKADNSPEATSEPVVRTFTCTIAEPDTKLAINDTDGKTTWEVNDKIMIHGGENGADRQLVTLGAGDISADGKTATISVTIDPYDRTASDVKSMYYAQYPGNLVPDGNMYYECCFNATNDKLMAACDVDGAFVFYNLCGIISYKVSGDFDQVQFSGNNDETVGYSDYYQVRIRNDKSGMVTNYFKPGNGFPTNTPAKSITSTVVADGTTINTICIPNPTGFTDGFTMKFLKSGSIVKTLSTDKPVTLTRGQYRPMGDVSAYLADYVAVTHASSITPVPADLADENLSKTASANCYIVSGSKTEDDYDNAGKIYKFKAYKGKGTTHAGTIQSVGVLWETYNTADAVTEHTVIAAVDYDKQSSKEYYEIVFQMPVQAKFHPGNAVIAAYDGPYDGDGKPTGNILWSWHIWVPRDAISYSTYGDKTSSKLMMSRNLGALVDTPADGSSVDVTSLGLLYQWGRKDPFVGMQSLGSSSFAAVAGTVKTNNGGKMTIAQTVANPTVFGNTSDDLRDWNSTPDNSLWGANGSTKTQYDPCPVGYKVPNRDLLRDFLNAVTWTPSMANYYVKADDIASYGFPIANHIYAKYGNMYGYEDGPLTYLWTSYRDDDASGTAYAMRIKKDGAVSMSATYKASAASVRCVAE